MTTKKQTKQQTIKNIMANLLILKKDFEEFKDWDTHDEDTWEAMIHLIEVVEDQVNQIA
jgi:hypothetical protein